MQTSRAPTESTLQHYQRMKDFIANGEIELNWSQIYALVFQDADLVSSDHARKVFRGFDLAIAADEGAVLRGSSGSDGNAENPSDPIPRHKNEVEHNRDGTLSSTKLVEMQDSEAKNPAFLLEAHGFGVDEWEIVTAKNSIWQAHCKGGSTKTLYSSKITVKPKKNGLDFEEIAKHFVKFTSEYVPSSVIPRQFEHGAELLVPCLFDCHIGKLAESSTGDKVYDLEIARRRILDSVQQYIDRLSNRKFEKIIFVIGNDYFNCEPSGSTVAGTPQSNCASYSTMFKKGVEILIEAINMFAQISKTEVLFIPGNHSSNSEWVASLILEAYFRNSDVISIDCTPETRKYRQFGNNLIGFTHGDSEKDRLWGLPQVECPEGWAASAKGSRDIITGHLHHEKVVEKNGVTVRHIPSLCSDDLWYKRTGYCSSKKRSMVFIYDKEDGLRETLYVNI